MLPKKKDELKAITNATALECYVTRWSQCQALQEKSIK